jgi:hypothetical protein
MTNGGGRGQRGLDAGRESSTKTGSGGHRAQAMEMEGNKAGGSTACRGSGGWLRFGEEGVVRMKIEKRDSSSHRIRVLVPIAPGHPPRKGLKRPLRCVRHGASWRAKAR